MTMIDEHGQNADGVCGDVHKSDTTAALATDQSYRNIPLFQYDLPKAGRKFGTLTVAHEIFHEIRDTKDFYTALGYGEEAKNIGLMDNEFVWERYIRDGAKMSKQCLQWQISIYLHNHSSIFNELYGYVYDALLAKCGLTVIDVNDLHCAKCPMIPRAKNF